MSTQVSLLLHFLKISEIAWAGNLKSAGEPHAAHGLGSTDKNEEHEL